MAYNPASLRLIVRVPEFALWLYRSAEAVADINGAGFIADAGNRGMAVNDMVIHIRTDTSAINFLTVNAISSGAADLTDGLAVGTVDSD